MPEPMDLTEPLDLEPIKARLAKYRDSFSPVLFIDSDVENLIAEVERLRVWQKAALELWQHQPIHILDEWMADQSPVIKPY